MHAFPCRPVWCRVFRFILLAALGLAFSSAPVLVAASPAAAPAEQRIQALRAEIAHHDELYFKRAAPEISDQAYDQLKRELHKLEQRHPEFAASQHHAIGDDRAGGFPAYRHGVPMLSLDKSYDETELGEFCTRVARQLGREDLTWVLEPKFDGLAISVTYEHGHLVRAATRGNGTVGDDVTANVRMLRNLPQTLQARDAKGNPVAVPDVVELRGEIYFTYAEFNRINAEREESGLEPYAHPRNLAAGTLKQTDPDDVARRHLSVVFYGWGRWEPATTEPATQLALHQIVQAWGLPGVKHVKIAHAFDAVWSGVQSFQKQRSKWGFPVDGVVLKLDEVAAREELGAGTAAPNWAIAYKFPSERVTTRVRGITIQVGRTGLLTPVAELEPVDIGGTTIIRASLHNRDVIRGLDVRVGDWVEVERAGEIIPQIAGVKREKRPEGLAPYVFPTLCPVCQTPVETDRGEVLVRCPNPDCPAQVRRRLEHFASANGVDIKGLGPALIQTLVESGLVKTPADLYRLDRAKLTATVHGKTADNLWEALERSRRAPLWRFITGLGIPRVGASTARTLAAHFQTLEALAQVQRQDLVTDHGQPVIPDLSIIISREVWEYFEDAAHRQVVVGLLEAGVQPARMTGQRPGPLAGKVFVLTGTLPTLTRAEAQQRITKAGGVVRTSVSGTTDFVVAGENAGAKLDAARQRGVMVIDEATLRAMISADGDEPAENTDAVDDIQADG